MNKLIVKKWFDAKFGNTYHSVVGTYEDKEFNSGITYGYGDHWKTTVIEQLKLKTEDYRNIEGMFQEIEIIPVKFKKYL